MLPGYADEHVEFAIVVGLRHHGMDVVTAQERNQTQTDDEVLLETATAEGRLLISRDQDFLRIHNEWKTTGKSHAGILFIKPKTRIGEAIRRILGFAQKNSPATAANTLKFI